MGAADAAGAAREAAAAGAGLHADLVEVLEEGRRRGLLGPGPVQAQIEHALAFAAVATGQDGGGDGGDRGPGEVIGPPTPSVGGGADRPALDLGTGGGLPGLVVALATPTSRWALLDSRKRSTAFVAEAVAALGLDDRVTVVLGRAEEVGRDPGHRGRYGLVVARGFGPPAVTAECAAPLLDVGGRLIVSEPPESGGERWPAEPLDMLGLRWRRTASLPHATLGVLEQVKACPGAFPRRTGVPAKRPLFENSSP